MQGSAAWCIQPARGSSRSGLRSRQCAGPTCIASSSMCRARPASHLDLYCTQTRSVMGDHKASYLHLLMSRSMSSPGRARPSQEGGPMRQHTMQHVARNVSGDLCSDKDDDAPEPSHEDDAWAPELCRNKGWLWCSHRTSPISMLSMPSLMPRPYP